MAGRWPKIVASLVRYHLDPRALSIYLSLTMEQLALGVVYQLVVLWTGPSSSTTPPANVMPIDHLERQAEFLVCLLRDAVCLREQASWRGVADRVITLGGDASGW